ncbi:MAG: inorganic phosphate transporter [Phycisphaerae bacterium]
MAVIDLSALDGFELVCLVLAIAMLFWDTVEVGRNDAANLVNAVLGARVLQRRTAILVAGAAVVLGAVLSSDVIDTARKGIFDPTGFGLKAALAIYISVYIVDTVLLYSYSAFGMPISTTACLVFELLGAAIAINASTVNWGKAGTVMAGIICSIILTVVVAFLIQRAARGAIKDRATHLPTMLLHGGWVGGGLAAGLCYFLLLKGMKNISWVKQVNIWLSRFDDAVEIGVGSAILFLFLWGGFAILIHMLLVVYRKRAARLLFPVLSVVGMISMAFAFGQNDLANCASPGLAAFHLLREQDVETGTQVPIAWWMLLICGLLLFVGMNTKNAARVTKAAVSTGSMGDHVELWAPRWCVRVATHLLELRKRAPALSPRAGVTAAGKTLHYDTLRACVIMSVSASVIATASSLGLPVSTTYVAFAAVVASGMADRIFQRGDAELKLGRAIWVVTSWVLSALIAALAAAFVATMVYQFAVWGMVGCLLVNLFVRRTFKKRADLQAKRTVEEAYERAHPEEFALEHEG